MEEQRTMALGLKDAAVEYGILAREADANLQLYNSVLQRMKEMGVAAELRASNVILVDEAEPPLEPAKPRKLFTLLLGILAGLGGGVALAFFSEYQDNTLRTPQEVERYLHLPSLGVVPDFALVDDQSTATRASLTQTDLLPEITANVGKELVLSFHPLSMVTEAYRELRTAILLSRAEEPPKTLLFTSSVPEEGKTTTTLNTAIVFSQMGVRVLVIDADLRRSGCHKPLGMWNGFGLTEILTGQRREAHEVIKALPMQNLFFLCSGTAAPNPTELVGSKKMYDTLASLREQYDYILIDAPPVRGISDAVMLSTMVDGVVLVTNAQRTMKQLVKEAQARLNYARANVLGVVLNKGDSGTEIYPTY
jgi:capsular exopolysaccharide synthesis family protein